MRYAPNVTKWHSLGHSRVTKWVHIVVHTLNHSLSHSLGHTMVASIVWFLFMCKQITQYLYLCVNIVCVW